MPLLVVHLCTILLCYCSLSCILQFLPFLRFCWHVIIHVILFRGSKVVVPIFFVTTSASKSHNKSFFAWDLILILTYFWFYVHWHNDKLVSLQLRFYCWKLIHNLPQSKNSTKYVLLIFNINTSLKNSLVNRENICYITVTKTI